VDVVATDEDLQTREVDDPGYCGTPNFEALAGTLQQADRHSDRA
jgi:hypothetical protein